MAHRFLKPGPLPWGVCSPLASREFHGAGLPSFLGQKPCLGPSLCQAGLRLLTLAGSTATTITFVWDPQVCENALCSSLQGLISKYPEQSSSNQTTDLATNPDSEPLLSPAKAAPLLQCACLWGQGALPLSGNPLLSVRFQITTGVPFCFLTEM